jgi:hypothetical protein
VGWRRADVRDVCMVAFRRIDFGMGWPPRVGVGGRGPCVVWGRCVRGVGRGVGRTLPFAVGGGEQGVCAVRRVVQGKVEL